MKKNISTGCLLLLFICSVHMHAQTGQKIDSIQTISNSIESVRENNYSPIDSAILIDGQSFYSNYVANHILFEKLGFKSYGEVVTIVGLYKIDTANAIENQKNYYDAVRKIAIANLSKKINTVTYLTNEKSPLDTIRYYVERINTYEGAIHSYDYLKKYIAKKEDNPKSTAYIGRLKSNLNIIGDQVTYLLRKEYCLYNNSSSGDDIVKTINFHHDNDVLMLTYKLNQDKDYTGGFWCELTTDYLKMNFVSALRPFDNILSYQGLFFGGEGYTPYIRNTDSLLRAERYANDRPFASYAYVGRSKFRMPYRAHWKLATYTKLGTIGSDKGSVIQSALHRDLTYTSVKPIGWENQIANGGRLTINFDVNYKYMLYSRDGDIFIDGRKEKNKAKLDDRSRFINVYGIADGKIGWETTSIGAGIGISTSNFHQKSGEEEILLDPYDRNRRCTLSGTVEFSYRYIEHNTLLEGFGMIRTQPDDKYDDEPLSSYVISKDDVVRNMLFLKAVAALRVRNSIIYYRVLYHTKEYDKKYASPIYGWGTIGFSFFI